MVNNNDKDTRTALMKAADIQLPQPQWWRRLLDGVMQLITRRQSLPPAKPAVDYAIPEQIDPHHFEDTAEGSGAFGRWILDDEQLPAYRYEMDQHRDVRAYYINTEGQDRREHWHQIGNHCVTALASNEGTVQVYLANRGGVFLNRSNTEASDRPTTLTGYINVVVRLLLRWYGQVRALWIRYSTGKKIVPRVTAIPESKPVATPPVKRGSPEDFAFAGGFGYLSDGKDTWATAYRYAPADSKPQRIFGIGYFKTELTHNDIHQTRWVYAPLQDEPDSLADDSVVLTEVEIENLGSEAVNLYYYEYWDMNVQQMQIQWIRSGLAAPFGDNQRYEINKGFSISYVPENDVQALRFHQELIPGSLADELDRREIDKTPFDVFLANLNPTPAEWYWDKVKFFGGGRGLNPDAIRFNHPPQTETPNLTATMPYCFVMRHKVHLEPHQKTTLRYAFGAAQPGQPLSFLKKYVDNDGWLQKTREGWKKRLAYFSTGGDPVLQREATWHSYNLLSATLFSERFNAHYTPQGSAYLYLHGAEGVPRDQSLFSMAMVYINPALAQETLKLLLGLRDADPANLALPYGYVGDGAVVKQIVIERIRLHAFPSDLDIYILLALAEYLSATGDMGFLDEQIALYQFDNETNPLPKISVLEHIQLAMKHLEMRGVGANKLLNIGDGDWDDGIVITNVLNPLKNGDIIDQDKTIQSGESVANSQMAYYTLPLIAAVIERSAPDLATRMKDMAQALKDALKVNQWDDKQGWFYRAYLWDTRNQPVTIGDHQLSLQSQVWPLITDLAKEMKIESQLMSTIQSLDDPSPTGAMIEKKGQVWPAITQLVTWGYRRVDPILAWRSLNRHTFAIHAIVFPNVWHNIWSGPDGTVSKGNPNEGGSWSSVATPMIDFPVMNSNQDAMAMIGLYRVCGIEPSLQGDGLEIILKAPPERYVLHTQLLYLEVESGRIKGEYHARVTGQCTLHVHLPEAATIMSVSIDTIPQAGIGIATDCIDFPLTFHPDPQSEQVIEFEAQWERNEPG